MNSLKNILLGLSLLFSSFTYSQNEKTETPEVSFGGALRFNYNLSSWKPSQKKRGGDFGFDLFRINAKASYKKVKLNAEYRLYSKGFGGGMLKHGWIEYDFSAKNNLQIGLTQVPFGITQYNSNNWFFSLNYYLGLEDDHDMGIKFSHKGEKLFYALAFFKNAEELNFGNNSTISNSRYSYDVGSIDIDNDGELDLNNKEINQFNGKIKYVLKNNKSQHQLGASIQYGSVYNLDTENRGSHYALAFHYQLIFKRFNLKSQITNYKYTLKNPQNTVNKLALTAYGAPYLVAKKATTYTLGSSYSVPVNWNPITNLNFYNDFGYMDKVNSNFEDSIMNVTGVLITSGNVYTYIDFAAGKNQPWLGPVWTNALEKGTPNSNWEMRFNINIGYYF